MNNNNNGFPVVELFGEKITLDKNIFVTMDDSFELFKLFPNLAEQMCFAGDYKTLCLAIKEQRPCIITPITKCVCSLTMEKGYDIIIQSEMKYVRLSELLNGAVDGSFGREIRPAQNWEKMLYSGCFDIKVDF